MKKKTPGDKSALLSKWLNRKKATSEPTGIQPIEQGKDLPQSFGQQRLWFLQQLYPGNPFYHYADLIRLKGPLDAKKLFDSYHLLAEKHEILRTTFSVKNGQPVQVTRDGKATEILSIDLRDKDHSDKENEVHNIASELARKPFDLSQGPLVRIALMVLSDADHFLLVSMHHIITDKWSMQLLRDEWAEIYASLVNGEPPKINKLPFQYSDYAYWLRQQKPDTKQLAFWKNKLAGELPVMDLPTDKIRPVSPTFGGAFSKRSYSDSLSGDLKALSSNSGTTMFVLMLAAYKVLLHRYSGQTDLLVGTPITNRDQTSLEKLIGFFNDTVVLRSQFNPETSFDGFLTEIKQTVLEAFSNKNTPFEELVKMLKPERTVNVNPLFQVMFLYHKVPPAPNFGEGITIKHEPFDFGVSKFDLTLYISEAEDQLSATIEYTSDLFEAETIERLHDSLETILEEITKDISQPLSTIPVLTTKERSKVLDIWNDTEITSDKKIIHDLINTQVAKNPQSIAVTANGHSLSYFELDKRSNYLANKLIRSGVKANTLIGLCLERSVELAIGILGILKAGGAYVPIDPDYPEERINYMVEDAQMPIVVTTDEFSYLFSGKGIKVIELGIDGQEADLLIEKPEIKPSDLAYVIYTSGSTGQPKGVKVSHANLVHSTTARFHYYENQPESFLLLSSFGFDSSVAGIFWSLTNGGTLTLPPKRIEQDLEKLAQIISENKVSHTLMLPSLYETILQHTDLSKLNSLQTVMVAGEACSGSLVARHFELMPHVELVNEYGPTEASVWCIAHKISPQDTVKVPIGQPIANTSVYILDKHMQPVPIGVAGELFIGGKGITQGYLNRPELTRDRFIQNPFSKEGHDLLYKTGDLASYRNNGIIDFHGRADQQVKIRGFRIELDEIKETLKKSQGVKDAIIIIANDQKSTEVEKDLSDPEILIEALSSLLEGEAEKLLTSIENLDEQELEFMLREFGDSDHVPSI